MGDSLRLLSLCTGVAGLDLSLAGALAVDLVAVSDIDKDAIRVLEHHLPGAPNIGDIREVEWSNLLPLDVQVVTAGYPCQPFALSGKRKGLDDPRHLYPYISEAVRILRPSIVYLENVPGHRSRGFGEVLEDLSSRGYRVGWTSVRASDIGAPHARERVFILGLRPTHPYPEVKSERSGLLTPPAFEVGGRRFHYRGSSSDQSSVFEWGKFEPAIRRWERETGSLAPSAAGVGPRGGLRCSATFGEWVMGYPPGWISGVPGMTLRNAQRLYGNAVVPPQGEAAFRILYDWVTRDDWY